MAISIDDQDKEMAEGFGAALAMTEEAVREDPEAGPRGLAVAMLVTLASTFWLVIGVWIGAQL